MVQWAGHHPVSPKVAGSIPGQHTCLVCGSGPQLGSCERQSINVSLPLLLSPFPSLSLKKKKERKKFR